MVKVEEMSNGKYMVTEGDRTLSGLAGTSKKIAEEIAANIKEQRALEKLRVSVLIDMIDNAPTKRERELAFHALRTKRVKRGIKWV